MRRSPTAVLVGAVAAALVIVATSVDRFLHPKELEQLGWGLAISTFASALNGGTAVILMQSGKSQSLIRFMAHPP